MHIQHSLYGTQPNTVPVKSYTGRLPLYVTASVINFCEEATTVAGRWVKTRNLFILQVVCRLQHLQDMMTLEEYDRFVCSFERKLF